MSRERRAPSFTADLHAKIPPGLKTMTRRLMKQQPTYTDGNLLSEGAKDGEIGISHSQAYKFHKTKSDGWYWKEMVAPHGQPGDVLALREGLQRRDGTRGPLAMYADGTVVWDRLTGKAREWERDTGEAWKRDSLTSMYMPLQCARDFVTVKRVWVERLHDITTADVWAEGLDEYEYEDWLDEAQSIAPAGSSFETPQMWFGHLIDKRYGCGTWGRNGWVRVYDWGDSYNRDPGRAMQDLPNKAAMGLVRD